MSTGLPDVIALICLVGVALVACTDPFLGGAKNSVTPPSFSPGGGVFGTDQSVALSAPSGATIY